MKENIRKHKGKIIVAILLAVFVIIFSSPTRAIKANALLTGCNWKSALTAEFRASDVNFMVKEYVVSNSEGILDFNGNKLATWRMADFLIIKYAWYHGEG